MTNLVYQVSLFSFQISIHTKLSPFVLYLELLCLSVSEIKNDLALLRKCYDSDSESSIRSEEVLTSEYPVKPRSNTQLKRENDLYQDENFKEINSEQVDLAFTVIKSILSQRKDIYDAEFLREDLEIAHQVSTFSFD
jgi:hypothetical protein